MDDYINKKDYNIPKSPLSNKESESLKYNSNNPFNINLGKTTYYMDIKNKENFATNKFTSTLKNNIIFESSNIMKDSNMKIIDKSDGGQLLVLNIKLKNLKPNKLLVLGAFIYENNKLYSFKVKKVSTKGLTSIECKDISSQFTFLFSNKNQIKEKHLKIKFLYNYVLS